MLQQATLDRIRAEASQVDPRRVALTLVAAPFFAAGWLLARVWLVVWTVLTWLYAAGKIGWRAGQGGA